MVSVQTGREQGSPRVLVESFDIEGVPDSEDEAFQGFLVCTLNDYDDLIDLTLSSKSGLTSTKGANTPTKASSSVMPWTAAEMYSLRAGCLDWKTGVSYFLRRIKRSGGYT